MLAYHLTEYFNLDKIKTSGLRAGMPTNYEHVGYGIYLFFDPKHANNLQEYLGLGNTDELGRTILAQVEVSPNDLLMDEDALYLYENNLENVLPPDILQEYLQLIEEYDGDDHPIDNPELGKAKTVFIDKHRLRPHPKLTTEWGHYSILTARYPKSHLQPQDMRIIFDGELYTEQELAEKDTSYY